MTKMISHRPRIKRALGKLTNLQEYYASVQDPRYMGEGYIPRFESMNGNPLNNESGEFQFSVIYCAQFREHGNMLCKEINYYE